MAAAQISTLLLLVAWLGLSSSSPVIKNEMSGPFFCKGLDCPKFDEKYNSTAYEIRVYEPSKWVSTTITGIDYTTASEEAFEKLYDYIQGDNDQKAKIPMTAPVINSVQPGAGPVCASNFTFSFFVPFKFQSNTPKPSNKELSLTMLGEQEVYVRVYSGFTDQTLFLKEAADLAAALNSSQTYDTSYYYLAGYDSPFTVRNRHNEVWFIAKDKK